jgi:hypothetical protein
VHSLRALENWVKQLDNASQGIQCLARSVYH